MANSLTVLLGSANAIPDDSTLSDLPHGQVDYLSHEWREEDVWRSWRNMTRLKNEIANGVRLENASWRTWWKQRNGLKTVTPETLNWLKDSDVTWLYGPLHTAGPTPRPSPSATAALDLPSSPSPTLVGAAGTARKPILKHRSICELLISEFPLSPLYSPPDSEEEDVPLIMSDGDPGLPHPVVRPSLMHTKSDTHITRWRPLRRVSPPRLGEMPASSLLKSDSPPSSVVPGQKRKHISFNTFVEQCIAIDKPKKKRSLFPTPNPHFGNHYPLDDDGYDEDSEDGIIDEADELLFDDDNDIHRDSPSYLPPRHSPPPHSVSPPSSSTSEEDEDEGVLQVRVRHPPSAPSLPRSPSHSTTSTPSSSPHLHPPKPRSTSHTSATHRKRRNNSFLVHSQSTDKELVTIALIAPTILKTKVDDDDDDDDACPPYPLQHISYPRRHNSKDWSPCGAHTSPVELVYAPPSYVYSPVEESEEIIQTAAPEDGQPQRLDHPISVSSPSATQPPVAQQEHYPDSLDSTHTAVDLNATRIPHHPEGASTVTVQQSPARPDVIVNSPDGHPDIPRSRSHSRSQSRSRSRTPSPNITPSSIATPSISATVAPRSNAPTQGTGGVFLAPSDSDTLRGRSASAPSLASQAHAEQSRGRSVTRTSSFSDRESLSTDSPLGRLSPEANVGLGIGSVGVRDRERDTRGEKEARRTTERGRDRLPRRSGSHSGSGSNSSLSPENSHPATSRAVAEQPKLEQLLVPEVRHKRTSDSSSSGSSTHTVVQLSASRSPPRLVLDAKPITQTSYTEAPSIPISPSYAQEEQESISRQPTPASSPVLSMHSPPSPSRPSLHSRRPSSSSRSPTRNGDDGQQGTLVGRAVEIMSNAGAFLGSFWHTGTPAGVPTT